MGHCFDKLTAFSVCLWAHEFRQRIFGQLSVLQSEIAAGTGGYGITGLAESGAGRVLSGAVIARPKCLVSGIANIEN